MCQEYFWQCLCPTILLSLSWAQDFRDCLAHCYTENLIECCFCCYSDRKVIKFQSDCFWNNPYLLMFNVEKVLPFFICVSVSNSGSESHHLGTCIPLSSEHPDLHQNDFSIQQNKEAKTNIIKWTKSIEWPLKFVIFSFLGGHRLTIIPILEHILFFHSPSLALNSNPCFVNAPLSFWQESA